MSLQKQLDDYKASFEAKAPPETLAIMRAATAALAASGQAERIPAPGSTAPAFSLPDQTGAQVSSADLLARGPLVVSFYRGVWCPYCNLDLKALQAVVAEIEAEGATLVAISPQNAVNSRKTVDTLSLTFPILSDAGNAVADSFGLRFKMPDDLVALYKGFGANLPAVNGDESWSLPMPARFVIAPDGTIAYSEASADYTRRPEPDAMLAALKSIV
ncbi:putative peroxiredoxin [Hartmannibacter diazotrophicus]|uniref:thioredoxin-dependent peroxiredoxin n=1 Tax=Hartmannibacter diazotrophicus TaxID=1482074 RepID=A0A2C9D7X5_9HYPH|nr:peroxiredoxin-like family protein [Hartmannibacter diazotrophicus]SON56417.1 putative peroxiredoxin [Hartmannibacter diazotrophicus]